MNVVLKMMKTFVIFSIATYRLESGLYALTFNTEAANFVIFDSSTKIY